MLCWYRNRQENKKRTRFEWNRDIENFNKNKTLLVNQAIRDLTLIPLILCSSCFDLDIDILKLFKVLYLYPY